MKRRVCLAAVLLMLFQPAHAITTFGGQDCGQWIANPNKIWLAGFLSGLNVSVAKNLYDPLNQLGSLDQAVLWIDKYCRANPLNRATGAATLLFIELEDRAKKQ